MWGLAKWLIGAAVGGVIGEYSGRGIDIILGDDDEENKDDRIPERKPDKPRADPGEEPVVVALRKRLYSEGEKILQNDREFKQLFSKYKKSVNNIERYGYRPYERGDR